MVRLGRLGGMLAIPLGRMLRAGLAAPLGLLASELGAGDGLRPVGHEHEVAPRGVGPEGLRALLGVEVAALVGPLRLRRERGLLGAAGGALLAARLAPVSYTHLTLPTILLV